MHFSETGLSEKVLRAVTSSGYEETTPIQGKAIPPILAGKDLLGVAQTGTGKTAAFALPTLDLLASSPKPPRAKKKKPQRKHGRGRAPATPDRDVRSLILAPTRELAAQILASLAKYGKSTGLRHAAIFGGVSQNPQVRRLQQGVDILVATPGRLLDLVNQGHIDLKQVEILILDEADQMLDMGFLPDLKKIVAAVPKKRQTLMFSATMPKEIQRLAEQWLTKPVDVRVAPASTPIESVAQSVWKVKQQLKPQLLVHYLCEYPWERTIIFTRTKHGADKVVKRLVKAGIKADAIHGNKSQNARTRSIEAFKSPRPPVLVATDIAARGLDISGVSHVINYDLPDVPETYVHRIGRTGRAGKTGIATSFCAPGERNQLKQIERLIRKSIEVEDDHPEYEKGTETDAPSAAPRRPARSGSRGPRKDSKGSGGFKGGASRGTGGKKYGDKKPNAKSAGSKKYGAKKTDNKKSDSPRAGSSSRSGNSKSAEKKYSTKRAPSDKKATDKKPAAKKSASKKPSSKPTTKANSKKSTAKPTGKGPKKGPSKGTKPKTTKSKSVASKAATSDDKPAKKKKKSRPGKRERQAIKEAKKKAE